MTEKSPSELTQELAHVLAGERAHTLPSILLVADIERRQTFVEEGFSSIWDYLRRVHKQSDTMIHYRVSCARAVIRFPQVIEFLRDGRLCMTTLAELMKVMNESNCDALLAEALGKSKRDAEKIVAREKPRAVPKDVTRTVAPTFPGKWTPELPGSKPAAEQPVQTEVLTESLARKHMTIDREYEELLKAARAALSHKMPGAAELDIIKEGFRAIIKQDEKRKGIVDKPRADKVATDGDVPKSVQRIVWKRDKGQCQWPAEDGGICGSTHRVQFHHKQDRGKGGLGSPENVILLCQKHNFLAAEISWGAEHMAQFRKQPSAPEDLQSQLEFT
jgi:hypothetical protein